MDPGPGYHGSWPWIPWVLALDTMGPGPGQRWNKMNAPRVQIFQSCANFCFFTQLLTGFAFFCAVFSIFGYFWKMLSILWTYFLCYFFRLAVLRVLFCKLFPSLALATMGPALFSLVGLVHWKTTLRVQLLNTMSCILPLFPYYFQFDNDIPEHKDFC